MRRWVGRIVDCVVLGAITTVAVAWGCAAWSPVAPTVVWSGTIASETESVPSKTFIVGRTILDPSRAEPLHAVRHFEGPGRSRLVWWKDVGNPPESHSTVLARELGGAVAYSLGARTDRVLSNPFAWSCVSDIARAEDAQGNVLTTFVIEDATGWPLRALASMAASPRFAQYDGSSMVDGFLLRMVPATTSGWAHEGHRFLPLRFLWPGFLVDTLLFGTVWFVLGAGVVIRIRSSRKRRGRCPMCAYDLRHAFMIGCPECGWNRVEGAEASRDQGSKSERRH